MERLLNIQELWKRNDIREFEVQASKFVTGLTPGGKDEVLLDAKEMGLCIYHYGPEKRVLPEFRFTPKIDSGNELVFIEYNHTEGLHKGMYHFDGYVYKLQNYTLRGLHLFQKGVGYRPVLTLNRSDVFVSAIETLRKIEQFNL